MNTLGWLSGLGRYTVVWTFESNCKYHSWVLILAKYCHLGIWKYLETSLLSGIWVSIIFTYANNIVINVSKLFLLWCMNIHSHSSPSQHVSLEWQVYYGAKWVKMPLSQPKQKCYFNSGRVSVATSLTPKMYPQAEPSHPLLDPTRFGKSVTFQESIKLIPRLEPISVNMFTEIGDL